MSTTVIAVVIASTFMHATWNLLVRGHDDKQTMVFRMLVVIVVGGLVPAAVSEYFARSMTWQMWVWGAVGGLANGLYYIFLARSLATTDFATAFPIIRALPVVLIALGDVARGHPLTQLGWLAIALVTAGCVLAPLRHFGDFSLKHYWRHSSVWILLAAAMIVGYTLPDKIAMELVKEGGGQLSLAAGARYQYFHLVFSFLTVAVAGRGLRRAEKVAIRAKADAAGEAPATPNFLHRWRLPATAAALNFAGYFMVLSCYQIVAHASYVNAMRQFSSVIGVILAFVIFKEGGRAVRLTGAVLIVAGIIVIKLSG